MTIRCDVTSIPSQCGGRFIHSFSGLGDHTLAQVKYLYSDFMLVATFNQTQKKAYLACCKTFTLLGQSTPIQNPHSYNYIFTAIFKA